MRIYPRHHEKELDILVLAPEKWQWDACGEGQAITFVYLIVPLTRRQLATRISLDTGAAGAAEAWTGSWVGVLQKMAGERVLGPCKRINSSSSMSPSMAKDNGTRSPSYQVGDHRVSLRSEFAALAPSVLRY